MQKDHLMRGKWELNGERMGMRNDLTEWQSAFNNSECVLSSEARNVVPKLFQLNQYGNTPFHPHPPLVSDATMRAAEFNIYNAWPHRICSITVKHLRNALLRSLCIWFEEWGGVDQIKNLSNCEHCTYRSLITPFIARNPQSDHSKYLFPWIVH